MPIRYPYPFTLLDPEQNAIISENVYLHYNGVSFYFQANTDAILNVLYVAQSTHILSDIEIWCMMLNAGNYQLPVRVDGERWYTAVTWLKNRYSLTHVRLDLYDGRTGLLATEKADVYNYNPIVRLEACDHWYLWRVTLRDGSQCHLHKDDVRDLPPSLKEIAQ
jgi:hypothetical protein